MSVHFAIQEKYLLKRHLSSKFWKNFEKKEKKNELKKIIQILYNSQTVDVSTLIDLP